MKKVFDQTVRDLKREVNKNVLKVPRIEQKVLDATSNEPWGPHGLLLSDIAMASRNYHEYQMIMTVVWKRINDTGKNWRHVYKALTVLEYMVAHGSERVIDEIREHAYQISTLSDFQYIDSSGRDQGSNVRTKSQSLVALVNDKERIIEVRQKAAANKDKYRSAASSGGMYRPGSGGYGDRYDDDRYEGRYGSRDDDRYGRNGDPYSSREREWGYRDDERYGKNGDSNSRDGDRYEERYGRDGYKDDNYRGRSQSIDDNQYVQRSRSSDRERDRSVDDDGQYSSRSGTRADDSIDGSKKLDRKFSEQKIGAPPSYEEAVSDSRSPVHVERDGEAPTAAAPKASSPPISAPPASTRPSQPITAPETSVSPATQEVQAFDEFDPRSSFSVNVSNPEMDLLGSLALAIVPTGPATTTTETESYSNSVPPPTSNAVNQPFGDPFGDSPFKAIPSETAQAQPQTSTSTDSFHAATAPKADTGSNFGFGDTLSGLTYSTPSFLTAQTPTNSEFLPPDLSTSHQGTDILANILPPGPSPAVASQPSTNAYANFQPQPGVALGTVPQIHSGPTGQQGHYLSHAPTVPMTSHMVPQATTVPNNTQFNSSHYLQQGPFATPNNGNAYPQQVAQQAPPMGLPGQLNTGNFLPQQTSVSAAAPQVSYQPPPSAAGLQPGNVVLGNLLPQTGSLATSAKPSNDKFETKSTVWADTLSRGLVNLNISGPKTNPLSDIGVDFDSLNRKEKRMEKPASTPVTSMVTMGKAMGSGSGIGRAGASGLRPPLNPVMGPGMGMGMNKGMGMGNYGGMNNQPIGMGAPGIGMGMNMGMGQGPPMQLPTGFPPGSNVPGGYNPMMGTGGGYAPQQPYGGYR